MQKNKNLPLLKKFEKLVSFLEALKKLGDCDGHILLKSGSDEAHTNRKAQNLETMGLSQVILKLSIQFNELVCSRLKR